MMAVIMATLVPVSPAIPAAMGTRAAMVPTLVPMDIDTKQAAMNMPARIICGGNRASVRFTVASMLPIAFAECAKAPASTKIQIMSIICSVAAP